MNWYRSKFIFISNLVLKYMMAICVVYLQAEDCLAQAFCMIGELQPAMHHCKASIKVNFPNISFNSFIFVMYSCGWTCTKKTNYSIDLL